MAQHKDGLWCYWTHFDANNTSKISAAVRRQACACPPPCPPPHPTPCSRLPQRFLRAFAPIPLPPAVWRRARPAAVRACVRARALPGRGGACRSGGAWFAAGRPPRLASPRFLLLLHVPLLLALLLLHVPPQPRDDAARS